MSGEGFRLGMIAFIAHEVATDPEHEPARRDAEREWSEMSDYAQDRWVRVAEAVAAEERAACATMLRQAATGIETASPVKDGAILIASGYRAAADKIERGDRPVTAREVEPRLPGHCGRRGVCEGEGACICRCEECDPALYADKTSEVADTQTEGPSPDRKAGVDQAPRSTVVRPLSPGGGSEEPGAPTAAGEGAPAPAPAETRPRRR